MANLELVPGILSFFSGLGVSRKIPPSTQGWGRVAWGMSFDKVKTNYPQASEVSGRKLEYVTESSPPGRGYKFIFGFDSGHQLDTFSLSFSGGSEATDYATLVQEFSRYLGNPVNATSTSTTWNRDQSQVTLSKQPDGGVVVSQIT